MKKIIYIAMLIAIITAALPVSAQTKVKGHVVNERGESIEYVSIGFENDSVGVISDAKGHFELTIPAGRKDELSFSHVSYLTAEIPYEKYAKNDKLTVVLKDKVVELAGQGSNLGPEGGVAFSCKKSYVISDILVKVSGCTFKKCKVSINIYERRGKQFVNIHQKPIYETITNEKSKYFLDICPEENIVLKPKTDYYVSIRVVDGFGDKGYLYLNAYMKSGLYRNAVKGKTKKLPVCPAIQVKGYEIEK